MFLSAINVVDDKDVVRLLPEFRAHLDVVESFFLKEIDQISLSFVDKVTVNACLGIHWNQLLLLPASHQGEPAQSSTHSLNGHHRSNFYVERNMNAIGLRVVLWWVLLNCAGEPVLL